MKELILKAIETAEKHHDYKTIEFIKDLLNQFIITYNAPSNWRELKEEIAEQYNDESSWIYENLQLWDI